MGLSLWSRTGLSRCLALVDCRPVATHQSAEISFSGGLSTHHFSSVRHASLGADFHPFLRNLTVVIFGDFVTVGPVASLHCVTVFSTVMGAHSISLTSGGALLAMLILGAHVSS